MEVKCYLHTFVYTPLLSCDAYVGHAFTFYSIFEEQKESFLTIPFMRNESYHFRGMRFFW